MICRKIRTLSLVVARCRNWPELTLMKIGPRGPVRRMILKNGLVFEVDDLRIRSRWGALFESAVADVYGIRTASPDVIVDVGANVGGFSCFAAFLHPESKVYSFEPQSDMAGFFENNLRLNDIKNVTLSRVPVTGDGRDVTFYAQPFGGASGIFNPREGKGVSMKSVTLDSLDLKRHKSLFLKLDCEGAEAEILEWVLANPESLPPRIRIACEWHHWCPAPVGETAAKLGEKSFRTRRISAFGEEYFFAERNSETGV